MIMPDGSRSPVGYLNWTKTWITHEYEKPGALWGINRKNYLNINIPEYAYFSKNEKIKVNILISDLKKVGIKPQISGRGLIVSQSIEAGTKIEKESICILKAELKE